MIVFAESAAGTDPVSAAAAALAESAAASAESYTPARLAEMASSEARIFSEGPLQTAISLFKAKPAPPPTHSPDGQEYDRMTSAEARKNIAAAVEKSKAMIGRSGTTPEIAARVVAVLDQIIAQHEKDDPGKVMLIAPFDPARPSPILLRDYLAFVKAERGRWAAAAK